jgi:hypothetical protein
MNFYEGAKDRDSIRVHPLLLSLTKAINEAETDPDISSISENDEGAKMNDLYTPPSAFPPLEMHFYGRNGPSLVSLRSNYAHTSAAGCRECVKFAPQVNSRGERDSAQSNSAAFCPMEDNIPHADDASPSVQNKGKKGRRTSSGGGKLSNTRGPKVAMVLRRSKRKQGQKAGSHSANPVSPEERVGQSSQEGSDLEVETCTFTGGRARHFADDIYTTRYRHRG